MKVKDVMTKNPVTVSVDTKVAEVAGLLRKYRISGLPVMDGDRLAGVVTETDILSLLEIDNISDDLWLPSPLEVIEVPIRELINWEKVHEALSDIGGIEVRKVMSSPAIAIDGEDDIEDAATLMLHEGIARLPVIHDDVLMGIISKSDILRGLMEGVAGSGRK